MYIVKPSAKKHFQGKHIPFYSFLVSCLSSLFLYIILLYILTQCGKKSIKVENIDKSLTDNDSHN